MSFSKALSNCSKLHLHSALASTSPIHNSSSSLIPKVRKPPWMKEKTQGGVRELPNTRSNLQEVIPSTQSISLSCKMRNTQNSRGRHAQIPFLRVNITTAHCIQIKHILMASAKPPPDAFYVSPNTDNFSCMCRLTPLSIA